MKAFIIISVGLAIFLLLVEPGKLKVEALNLSRARLVNLNVIYF